MTAMNLRSFDADMKDMYALPGTRLKQWVVDMRRELEWERESCPKLSVPPHSEELDDVEAASGDQLRECASVGLTSWQDIDGRDCRFCEGFAHAAACLPQMLEWFAAKDARPPICADRSLLSDEVQPDISLRDNPLLSFLRGRNA